MPGTSPAVATVPRLAGRKRKLKKARGFSPGELSQAGVQASQARSFGIRVDQRRSTVHAQNVAAMKAFLDESEQKTSISQPSIVTATEGSEPEGDSAQAEKKSRRHKTTRAKKQAS